MKIYFAGCFEYLKSPKKEKELADFCIANFGEYNRLSSFFFLKETDNVFSVVKTLKEEQGG